MTGGSTKDSRQVVGGSVWAKAASISRDFKRILGNQFDKTWIEGKVIRVEKRKASDLAKRSTTYVVAKYPCEVHDGVQQYKEKEIPLQNLKDKNPNSPTVEEATPPQDEPQPPRTTQTPPMPPLPGTVQTSTTGTNSTATNGSSTSTQEGRRQTPNTTNTTGGMATTTTSNSSTSTTVPVVECHDRKWFEGNTEAVVNGKHSSKAWKLEDQYGRGFEFTPGCDRGPKPKYTALDYFLAVFPKQQLQDMQERTSKELEDNGLQPTSVGELLKFMGVLILITRFEFGARASLWSTVARNRFIPPPNFGHTTGMSRERFDSLWRFVVWSQQPKQRPEGMSHEEYRWALVQDFVENFNEHRETFYFSSYLICADESISRWYGLGGNWINMGLPHYVAMDRKPEHGCEIQNCCDGISGIMMRLKLVKSSAAEAAITQEQRVAAAEADAT
jgi:Transposase IS4